MPVALFGTGLFGDGTFGSTAGIPRVQVEALIEWAAYPAGALVIAADDTDTTAGTIALDDSDLTAGTIAAGDWSAGFAGDHDDVSAMLQSVTIEGGRNGLLDHMEASRATLTLRDHTGLLNHANAASPLHGQIEDRMHPIRVRVAYDGVWRTRFFGYTRRIRWQPRGRKGYAVVECVDFFYWLQRAKPVIASTGETTTGAAIGLILDEIRMIDPDSRDLDPGDVIPGFSADGTKTGLELIEGLLDAERGVFYRAADGRATFDDRHARFLRESEATIVDVMTNLEPEVDFDRVRNRVRVSRVDADGEVTYTAEATDDDSIIRINVADEQEIQTPYLQSDAQAESLADWILPLVATPVAPVRDLVIDGREPALVEAILDLDLVDRVTLESAAAGAGGEIGDYHIDRYAIQIAEGGLIAATYLASAASPLSLLLIAADDTDTAAGTIALDDADIAAGIVAY